MYSEGKQSEPLNDYELKIIQNNYTGIKSIEGYQLIKLTEWEAFIVTPLSPNWKPKPPRTAKDKKVKRSKGTRFQIAEDGDGKEFVLIGQEYIPLEYIPKHKDFTS